MDNLVKLVESVELVEYIQKILIIFAYNSLISRFFFYFSLHFSMNFDGVLGGITNDHSDHFAQRYFGNRNLQTILHGGGAGFRPTSLNTL